jgi:carbon starvation protein
VTLVPLIWLVAVTFTAGVQKIFHSDPRIGFLAQAQVLEKKRPDLEREATKANLAMLPAALKNAGPNSSLMTREQQVQAEAALVASQAAYKTATAAVATNRTLHFNQVLDAVVAGLFLALVSVIVLVSVREWVMLLAHRKQAQLREDDPVWLPEYALARSPRLGWLGFLALLLGLAKELSGEAAIDRAQQHAAVCIPCTNLDLSDAMNRENLTRGAAYVRANDERFARVNRCC